MDVAAHKKRLQLMLAVVTISFIAAVAMIFLSIRTHSVFATGGFIGALIAGFGAQAWMIWSWKKAESQQAKGKG
jgi:uncharacterized YccA/Bax inhibitor family protein